MTDQPDPQAALAFLRRARPAGFWVLVAIDPELPRGSVGQIECRSFAARDPADLEAWVRARNESGRNLYWTVNSIPRPIARKPAREDVEALDFLHVDVDPDKRLPLAEERARIEALFGANYPKGLPAPSFVIDSGGGLQGFWRLEPSLQIGGSPEAYEDAARYNRQLEVLFGADACHNVDRIMRLPGTINWPDSRKRAAGREPRLATLLSISDVAYPISAFIPAAPTQSSDVGFAAPRASVDTGNVQRLLSLDELPQTVPGMVKVVINQGLDPDNPRRWPSRSEPLFWVCCELVRNGVADDVIYSVITDPDFAISESVLEKGRDSERFALHQIQSAHEHSTHPMLAELNRRHAVIGDMGGRCRVISEEHDEILDRPLISPQTFEDFRNRYLNRQVEVQITTKSGSPGTGQMQLGQWWLTHPLRRGYDRIVFSPGREVRGAYNLWRGYDCAAVPGDCSLYLKHVRENICGGEAKIADYVLDWMASAVQRPGQQGHTAIVVRGTRGAGKGVFAQWFGGLFGRHFMQITNPQQLVGQFNHHLRDTVVLYADEAFFAGDKRHEAVLKGLVTERFFTSEAKYQQAEMALNCLHIIIAANEDWVVPAGPHERRFLVLQAGDKNLQDGAFFDAIERQMLDGGREALLHELLSRDLSRFSPRQVPRTAGLQEQKAHSLRLEEEWWYSKLQSGEVRDGAGWPGWIACSELTFDFGVHADRWGKGRRCSHVQLGRLLEKVGLSRRQLGRTVEVLTEDGRAQRVQRPRVYQIPPLDEARAAWARLMGGEFEWGTVEVLRETTTDEPYA